MGKLFILYLWALVPYAYLITYTDLTRDMIVDAITSWIMGQVHVLDAYPALQRPYMIIMFTFILVCQIESIRNPP